MSEWLSGKSSSNGKDADAPGALRAGDLRGLSRRECALAVGVGEIGALDLAGLVDLEDVAFFTSLNPSSRMPHSKPSATSRASSLNRLSCPIVGVVDYRAVVHAWTLALRRMIPFVTMQPAIVPSRETLKGARTSASPSISSVSTGESIPTSPLDVLGELVDDAVRPDVDAFALGERSRLAVRPHVEAEHDRVRRPARLTSFSVIPPTPRMDDVDPDLRVLDLRDLGDVQGSVEALVAEVEKIQHPEVRVHVIHKRRRRDHRERRQPRRGLERARRRLQRAAECRRRAPLAEREGVDIRTYRVIYQLTDDIEQALVGMLRPVQTEETIGEAEVRATLQGLPPGHDRGLHGHKRRLRRSAKVPRWSATAR